MTNMTFKMLGLLMLNQYFFIVKLSVAIPIKSLLRKILQTIYVQQNKIATFLRVKF